MNAQKHTTERKQRKERKLSTKLIIGIIIYAVLNLIIVSLIIGVDYAYSEEKDITERAYSHVRAASEFINGDTVTDYLQLVGTDENGKPIYYTDEYSEYVVRFLDCTREQASYLLYYYVFIPGEDGIVYIWDAYTDDEHFSPCGTYEEYNSEAEKKAIMAAYHRETTEKEDEKENVLLEFKTSWGNLASAYTPIYNSDGEPVAMVGADLSVERFQSFLLHSFGLIVLGIAFVTLVSAIIAYTFVKRHLIKPIEQLNEATQDLVGELDSGKQFELEIHTGDELETLADSFRKMYSDLQDYLDRLSSVTTERERIHAEFDIARNIQESIIPHDYPAFPERNDFDIYAEIKPCEGIGGDFYDFFLIDDDHLVMVMGDVCERGVGGALYMIMVQTLIKNRAMQGFSPAEMLQNISTQMLEQNMELFATVWLAILELSTGKGIAANAGYQHPILCRGGKKFETQVYQHSPPVGAMPDVRFHDHGFQLDPGDTVFIYSDGVREAIDKEYEIFGTDRILKALNWDPEATPSVLLQNVKSEIDRFAGETVQQDDLGMLAIKYYGSSAKTEQDAAE